jgi:hypothetical protein
MITQLIQRWTDKIELNYTDVRIARLCLKSLRLLNNKQCMLDRRAERIQLNCRMTTNQCPYYKATSLYTTIYSCLSKPLQPPIVTCTAQALEFVKPGQATYACHILQLSDKLNKPTWILYYNESNYKSDAGRKAQESHNRSQNRLASKKNGVHILRHPLLTACECQNTCNETSKYTALSATALFHKLDRVWKICRLPSCNWLQKPNSFTFEPWTK